VIDTRTVAALRLTDRIDRRHVRDTDRARRDEPANRQDRATSGRGDDGRATNRQGDDDRASNRQDREDRPITGRNNEDRSRMGRGEERSTTGQGAQDERRALPDRDGPSGRGAQPRADQGVPSGQALGERNAPRRATTGQAPSEPRANRAEQDRPLQNR
jgi:hypothetical protein